MHPTDQLAAEIRHLLGSIFPEEVRQGMDLRVRFRRRLRRREARRNSAPGRRFALAA